MVVLCFVRGTEGLGSGVSALRRNQSAGFGKPTSSFNTSATLRGEYCTLPQSLCKGIPGSQALDWHLCRASFQGALPTQAPADRTQERSRQRDWLHLPPTSSVIKPHLPSLGFCPFSAWKCQANKGEGSNGGKKQSHLSKKCFLKPQNKQLGETGNYIAFNL